MIERLTDGERAELTAGLQAALEAGGAHEPETLAAWLTLQQDAISGLCNAAEQTQAMTGGLIEAVQRIQSYLGFVPPPYEPPPLRLVGGSDRRPRPRGA